MIHKFPNIRYGVIYIVHLKFCYISVLIISYNSEPFDLVNVAFAWEVPSLNFDFRYW